MLGKLELLALSAALNPEETETLKLSSADLLPGVMAEEMVVEGWEVSPG